jgi:thiamine pyrophosphokinase
MDTIETKLLTMVDAVKAYQERQAEQQARDTEHAAELASELTKLLTLGGLVPLRVEGNV